MTWITDDDKSRVAQEVETEEAIRSAARYLAYMKERGSSLTLDWGEDSDMWECSWISGGDRFTGVARSPLRAAVDCYEAMMKAKREAQ